MFDSDNPNVNSSNVPFQNNTAPPRPPGTSAAPLNLQEQSQIETVNQNFLQFAQSISAFQAALNNLINNV